MLITSLAVLSVQVYVSLGCSSVQHSAYHPLVPALFTYTSNDSEGTKACAEMLTYEECNPVAINLQGLLGKNLLLPFTPSPILTNMIGENKENLILTKESEEGVEFLFQKGSISTLTYSSSFGPVVFVVKNGQVFGSVRWKDGVRYRIQPCPVSTEGKDPSGSHCHVWLRGKSKAKPSLTKN